MLFGNFICKIGINQKFLKTRSSARVDTCKKAAFTFLGYYKGYNNLAKIMKNGISESKWHSMICFKSILEYQTHPV